MRPQIVSINGTLTGRTARKLIGCCALAAVGAGFLAISTHTFGADLGPGYSAAIAVPSNAVPASRRPMLAHPIVPPDAIRDLQHARIVDQLYQEIMRRSSAECSPATNNASMMGAC